MLKRGKFRINSPVFAFNLSGVPTDYKKKQRLCRYFDFDTASVRALTQIFSAKSAVTANLSLKPECFGKTAAISRVVGYLPGEESDFVLRHIAVDIGEGLDYAARFAAHVAVGCCLFVDGCA